MLQIGIRYGRPRCNFCYRPSSNEVRILLSIRHRSDMNDAAEIQPKEHGSGTPGLSRIEHQASGLTRDSGARCTRWKVVIRHSSARFVRTDSECNLYGGNGFYE
jgi:hypothetical protein